MSDQNLKTTSSEEEYKIHAHPNHDFVTTAHGLARVYTSDTHVQLGEMTFHKDDFMRAFEGYLNPGYSPAPSRRFANPVPVGVAGFSLTLFVLSLVNVGARHLPNAKGVAGLCFVYAGIIELISGVWCIVIENTWAATLLCGFSAFWFSYGLFLIDAWGMISVYTDPTDVGTLEGFFLVGWTIFSFIMWLFTFRSTWVLWFMMLFVTLTLLVLAAGSFMIGVNATANEGLTKAGGVFGLLAAFIGWYVTYEGIATPENALVVPPVLLMPTTVVGQRKKKNSDEEKV